MIFLIATLTVKPEKKAELLEAAQDAITETRKEAGCIAYDLYESASDATKVVFVEEWESAEALAPHAKSPHMRAFGKVAVNCLSAPSDIRIITPETVETR